MTCVTLWHDNVWHVWHVWQVICHSIKSRWIWSSIPHPGLRWHCSLVFILLWKSSHKSLAPLRSHSAIIGAANSFKTNKTHWQEGDQSLMRSAVLTEFDLSPFVHVGSLPSWYFITVSLKSHHTLKGMIWPTQQRPAVIQRPGNSRCVPDNVPSHHGVRAPYSGRAVTWAHWPSSRSTAVKPSLRAHSGVFGRRGGRRYALLNMLQITLRAGRVTEKFVFGSEEIG